MSDDRNDVELKFGKREDTMPYAQRIKMRKLF
jgi:hypothetical protein